MAIPYKVKPKRNVQNGKDEIKYYAVPSSIAIVTLDHIAKEISGKSALSPGDIYSTTISITESIATYLAMGVRVKIDGLGIFSLAITSDGVDEKDKLTARDVRISKICFLPDAKLRKNLYKTGFVPAEKK